MQKKVAEEAQEYIIAPCVHCKLRKAMKSRNAYYGWRGYCATAYLVFRGYECDECKGANDAQESDAEGS